MTSSSLPSASDDHGVPPPLPPRRPEQSLANMSSHDPRSSSTQSLVPDAAFEETGRRKLLLIYVHGFLGDETSFRSFPAHLHNLLTITLADSHVVHSKIYPKYRSRYALEVARDDFSKWLTPHESPSTDIVLLGHSMGGLLAADITLLFHHNIIGVVNFDVPFLGMHPGIVKAGLASIFKPWPTPEDQGAVEASGDTPGKRPSRMNTLFNLKPSDPNYNPSFHNDVHLPVRKGWENALHWVNKHSNGIIAASKGLVKSHVEFGGAMADYRELKDRYARIRALEEENEAKRRSANPGVRSPPRIRFVNYYTASTGRPKKPKSPKSQSPSRPTSRNLEHTTSSNTGLASESQLTLSQNPSESVSGGPSPRISVEEHRGDEVVPVTPQEPLSATTPTNQPSIRSVSWDNESPPNLPEIPPIPQEPPFVDLAQYSDKNERKAAEKEHSNALKEYQRAVKSRNTVIKERSKLEEKWQKQKQKQKQGQGQETAHQNTPPPDNRPDSGHEISNLNEDFGAMQVGVTSSGQEQKLSQPYGNYDFSRSTILAQPHPDDRSSIGDSSAPSYADSMHTLTTQDSNDITLHDPSSSPSSPKKKRYKKFCMLPPKDAQGNKDPTWIRVFMEDIDAVTAHTTLFFVSESYERLVGDVAARIEDWIRENESLKLVRDLEGL